MSTVTWGRPAKYRYGRVFHHNSNFNSCCHNSLISLPELQVNIQLKELLLNSTNFAQNIQKYNSITAFAPYCPWKKISLVYHNTDIMVWLESTWSLFSPSTVPGLYQFTDNKWVPQKRGNGKIIVRMYAITPNDYSSFYIRTLLLHIKGATSFTDLCSYNSVTYHYHTKKQQMHVDCLKMTQCYKFLEQMQSTHMLHQLW